MQLDISPLTELASKTLPWFHELDEKKNHPIIGINLNFQ